MKKKDNLKYLTNTLLNSYSQVFFSLDKFLALSILFATFLIPKIGLIGLLSVVLVNLTAYLIGFDRKEISEGIFGFNALLFGLALGAKFEINGPFILLFLISNVSLLIFNAVFKGTFGKVNLPFLSIPFIVNYWLVSLAATELSSIRIVEQIANSGNAFHSMDLRLSNLIVFVEQFKIPEIIRIFFHTLSATFFVPSITGGILISLALFLFSRISFSLSVIGFLMAFLVYDFFGADIGMLSNNMVGSNYIFFAIAAGGFFLIPNIYSYLSVVLLVPVLMLLQIALDKLFLGFDLKTFTLAFSILTGIFLYALHQRWLHKLLHLVNVQYYSAEKTVYKYLNAVSRFNFAHYKKIALPFWGEWQVSQGYEGKITHLGEWSKALDFVVIDETGKTYQEPGINVDDFYCYNKPILAPADAYVYDIVSYLEDNVIGGVDTEKNWGNTIVLNHLDGLFSQISHLKKDSIKVNIGDFVTRGTILATCGSSGRSPEPHLHFQLQTQGKVGSKTIYYPISYFLERTEENSLTLKIYEVPKEGSVISNVEPQPMLMNAFTWLPESKMRFKNQHSGIEVEWEIHTDAWNQLYIYEASSHSYAYFINDGTRFYFTDFEGNRKSLLFHLYASCYSVLLGTYPKICLHDKLPIIHFNTPILIWIQDFLAPFYLFTEAVYQSETARFSDAIAPEHLTIQSRVESKFIGKRYSSVQYQLKINKTGLVEIQIQSGHLDEKWICVN